MRKRQEPLICAVTVKLTEDQMLRLDSICRKRGIARGYFTRLVLREAIALAERGEIEIPKPGIRARPRRKSSRKK